MKFASKLYYVVDLDLNLSLMDLVYGVSIQSSRLVRIGRLSLAVVQ